MKNFEQGLREHEEAQQWQKEHQTHEEEEGSYVHQEASQVPPLPSF
jgi:hypothetical protein